MYYVYEWFIVDTGEIIYVGKGVRNRYKVRKHNKFFNNMIKRFNCDSRIVKTFETEKEAFSYEFDRIRELKQKNQCVCNIHEGGFGGTTDWWTEEQREKYSERNVMKSTAQRKRMSLNNPMKNKVIASKVNAKKRRAVIIDGVEYESVRAVAKKYGISTSAVTGWCWNGITSHGESCRYKDIENPSLYINVNRGKQKPVTYNGKHYKSSAELGRIVGVSQTTASRWCRNGRDPYGNLCRYDDDKREIICSTEKNKIPVIINGIWYPSKEKARKAIGVTAYTLTQYLEGKKKDDRYICKYDNQQPSQGNTDKSTLEGSTTNG